jgi:SAM-dependent methyltransferase
MTDPSFRRDLYRGTAAHYERFRLPYPPSLIADLAARAGLAGTSRLLDLACGTGQVSFAMRGHAGEIWAVDQEPGMIEFARSKASAAGGSEIRLITASAEDLTAPGEAFDLVTIGNAFHRLPRAEIAERALQWLRPGGRLALLWGGSPLDGHHEPWQRAMVATMSKWSDLAGASDRLPPDYAASRRTQPDSLVLRQSGFAIEGRHEFPAGHDWTIEELTGHVLSTSVLSRAALGEHAHAFEQDLAHELAAAERSGRFHQDIVFAYDLARRPGR